MVSLLKMSSEVSEDSATDTGFRHLIVNRIEDAKRLEVFQYFGTASRSMFTMFELTLATLGILFLLNLAGRFLVPQLLLSDIPAMACECVRPRNWTIVGRSLTENVSDPSVA